MKRQEKWGREGTQKHMRNKTRKTLDDISKLRTWKCMCIQLQAPADHPAESKLINTQEQQTRLATKGNLQERYRESRGKLQETLGTPTTLRYCQDTPGNAGNAKGNTRER